MRPAGGALLLLEGALEAEEKDDDSDDADEDEGAAAAAEGRRWGPPAPRSPSAPLEALVVVPLRAAATRAATALRVEAADRGQPGSVVVFLAESRFQDEEELLLLLLRGGVLADARA